jgi:hypothetical protein
MTLPIDTSYFGVPLIVFGLFLSAYGVYEFFSREELTASCLIHFLLGIFVMIPGFLFFVRGG